MCFDEFETVGDGYITVEYMALISRAKTKGGVMPVGAHFLLSNNPRSWDCMVLNSTSEIFMDADSLKGVDAVIDTAGPVSEGYSGHITVGRYMMIEIAG